MSYFFIWLCTYVPKKGSLIVEIFLVLLSLFSMLQFWDKERKLILTEITKYLN